MKLPSVVWCFIALLLVAGCVRSSGTGSVTPHGADSVPGSANTASAVFSVKMPAGWGTSTSSGQAALDNLGATIVGPGTIIDRDGNAVVPKLVDSDTTGDSSIGAYDGKADSWSITYKAGDISSPTFTLSAPGNAGLSPVTQVLTVSTALTTLTTTDTSLRLGTYGVGYPKYGRVAPPVSVECVPSNCDAKYPGLYVYNSARRAIWNIGPDGWAVNTSASGSSTVKYTGSGSIVATVDFAGLTNAFVNGGPIIIYGREPCCALNADAQGITFPLQLSSLNAFNVDVAYTLNNTAAPYDQDVMFDEYLMPTSSYTGGHAGAVECGVKLYSNFGQPSSWYVGTITVPFTINGTTTNETYSEYYNGETIGSTPHPQVYFTIGNPSNSSPFGTSSGEVAFNILPFLNACATIVPNTGSSWWVSGMLLTSEYGAGSTDQTPAVDYTWTITKILYQETLY